jgi:hypothetical protein
LEWPGKGGEPGFCISGSDFDLPLRGAISNANNFTPYYPF